MSERDKWRARELARRHERKAIAREARFAAFDVLVVGWLGAGGPIPWEAVPQNRAAREASRRRH